jgi:hypothetical protein
MQFIDKVYISQRSLEETSVALRTYGKQGCEGLVLWLGHLKDDKSCNVERILVPSQESIKGEDGVGYFVTSKTLFEINKLLSSTGLRLIAQVHSHPGRAYHSTADDRYCIVTTEGGFSIVVPDFGFGVSSLLHWATYRLTNGMWRNIPAQAVRTIFVVDGFSEIKDPSTTGLFSRLSKMLKGGPHD